MAAGFPPPPKGSKPGGPRYEAYRRALARQRVAHQSVGSWLSYTFKRRRPLEVAEHLGGRE